MDQTQFAARVEALKQQLYRTALLYLNDPSLALDAVDEAVYRGLTGCHKLRQPAFFDTWMTRILINECHKEQRRRKRLSFTDTLPEQTAEHFDALPLNEALYQLPPDLKTVVILRYFNGLTLAETAERLDIPQGTVVTRQRRALALLRLSLSEEEQA